MKVALLALAVIVAALQFFRPAKNLPPPGPNPVALAATHPVPPAVQTLLQRACYDCHSNHTRYPWYAEIQPVGWWLASHVKEGKAHLNFSAFGNYPLRRQAVKLGEIVDEVEEGHMPLASYKLAHPEARLTPAEIRTLVDWADALRDELPEH